MQAAGDPAATSGAAALCESDFGAFCSYSVGSAGSDVDSKHRPQGSKSNPWKRISTRQRTKGLELHSAIQDVSSCEFEGDLHFKCLEPAAQFFVLASFRSSLLWRTVAR